MRTGRYFRDILGTRDSEVLRKPAASAVRVFASHSLAPVEEGGGADAAQGMELDSKPEKIGTAAKLVGDVSWNAGCRQDNVFSGIQRGRENQRLLWQLHQREVHVDTIRSAGDQTLLRRLDGEQHGDGVVVEINIPPALPPSARCRRPQIEAVVAQDALLELI